MRIEFCLLGYYSEIFLKRNFTPIKFTTPEFSDHYYKNLIGGHIPSRYRSKYNFFSKKIVSGGDMCTKLYPYIRDFILCSIVKISINK